MSQVCLPFSTFSLLHLIWRCRTTVVFQHYPYKVGSMAWCLRHFHCRSLILMLMVTSNCMLVGVSSQTLPSSRPPNCSSAEVTEQDVANQVFSRYGNWQRPVRIASQPALVNIALALSSINDVIEKNRIIRITGYLSVRWFDQLRVWNKTFPLNCVTYVVLPATEVWLPDIALMNAETHYELMRLEGEKVRVYSDGYTVYSPGGTFSVFCEFDLTLFPFDEQKCSINLESWRYTHGFMRFNLSEIPAVKRYQWIENEQWELVNTSENLAGISYFDPENSFDRVEFQIYIKRKSYYYLIAVIIPGSLIAFAQIAVFSLPLEEVQKFAILFTCLLAYLVFMLMIVSDLPRSSDKVPLLSIYINVSMALIAMSIIGECIVFFILRRARTRHPDGPGFAPNYVVKVAMTVSKFLRIHSIQTPKLTNILPASKMPTDIYFMQRYGQNNWNREQEDHEKWSMEKFEHKATIDSDGDLITANNGDREQGGSHLYQSKRYRQESTVNSDGLDGGRKKGNIENARLQWNYIAEVADRVTMFAYLTGIVLVPVVMFAIIPVCYHPC